MAFVPPVKADADAWFCGEVTIGPRQKSILTAIEASDAAFDPDDRVFFASSVSTRQKGQRDEDTGRVETTRWAGAGIAYRQPTAAEGEAGPWRSEMVGVGASARNRFAEAGISAIAECLAIAAREMAHGAEVEVEGMRQRRVRVFTDCEPALLKIKKVRGKPTGFELKSLRGRLKLTTMSQLLSRHLGVEVELRWVPERSGVAGCTQAEDAAQEAVMGPDQKL